MPDCLLGKVGIIGCGQTGSDTGININDLQGISLEFLSKIADAESPTWMAVFTAAEKAALQSITTRAYFLLKQCHKVTSKTCADDIICANEELYYEALRLQIGMKLMLERIYSQRWNKWTISKDEARKVYDDYKTHFEEELLIAVETSDLTDYTDCIECAGGSQGTQFVTTLP